MAESTYKVGYKRPPLETRFKPGMSGNPTGKRKRRRSLSEQLDRILAEKLSVTEGGIAKRMNREEVFLRQTVTRAIAGDRQFGKLLIDYLSRRQESAPEESTSATDEFLVSELVSILTASKPE
ncbi:MAG: hypothetical protein JO335_04215 [Sphingomonas sp.]|nr:hypothetical protein [Sphingomonas sp.]